MVRSILAVLFLAVCAMAQDTIPGNVDYTNANGQTVRAITESHPKAAARKNIYYLDTVVQIDSVYRKAGSGVPNERIFRGVVYIKTIKSDSAAVGTDTSQHRTTQLWNTSSHWEEITRDSVLRR